MYCVTVHRFFCILHSKKFKFDRLSKIEDRNNFDNCDNLLSHNDLVKCGCSKQVAVLLAE